MLCYRENQLCFVFSVLATTIRPKCEWCRSQVFLASIIHGEQVREFSHSMTSPITLFFYISAEKWNICCSNSTPAWSWSYPTEIWVAPFWVCVGLGHGFWNPCESWTCLRLGLLVHKFNPSIRLIYKTWIKIMIA